MINYDQLRQKVFESLGAASVCWSNPSGAGEFDAHKANEIGDELMDAIDKYVEEELYYATTRPNP